MTKLSDLGFQGGHGPLNIPEESVEKTIGPIGAVGLGSVESYVKGDIELVLRIVAGYEEFDLCFSVIPERISRRLNGGIVRNENMQRIPTDDDGCDQGVLFEVTHIVQSPKMNIPVFVRLERPKHRPNVLGHGSTAVHCVVEAGRIVSKRKVTRSELGNCMTVSDGASVDRVIESGPHIVKAIPDQQTKIAQHIGISQTEFVNLVSRLKICLDDYFVRVFGLENADERTKLADVMLCPINL